MASRKQADSERRPVQTLGQLLEYIAVGQHKTRKDFVLWPPDIFAVVAIILRHTGAYLSLLRDAAHHQQRSPSFTESLGARWREAAAAYWLNEAGASAPDRRLPKEVSAAWANLLGKSSLALDEVQDDLELCGDLLLLLTAADVACAGVGLPSSADLSDDTAIELKEVFEYIAEMNLSIRGSATHRVPPTAARVLPKMHTPQSGFNLRSLTHHLALHLGDDVKPAWVPTPSYDGQEEIESFNMLLAPWPLTLDASRFKPAQIDEDLGDGYGYVAYDGVGSRSALSKWLRGVLRNARAKGQRIDLIVFPELALSELEWEEACKICFAPRISLVAGVYVKPKGRNQHSRNELRMYLPFLKKIRLPPLEVRQSKHHRWKIDSDQVRGYSLGATLGSCNRKTWWESFQFEPRFLHFIVFTNLFVMCPLLCEDLARQDPVAELVRGVGPNLVLALLMDGPQLPVRWAARYATVLADDPGSSVLTLTSLGMVELSSNGPKASPSRAVALWKDAIGGLRTLELPKDCTAMVLNLHFEKRREWTADRRHDDDMSSTPVLAGVHHLKG